MVDLSQGCRCAPTTGLELANAFGVHQSYPATASAMSAGVEKLGRKTFRSLS